MDIGPLGTNHACLFLFFWVTLGYEVEVNEWEMEVSKSQQGNDGFDGNGGAHSGGLGYGFSRWWQDGVLGGG